MNTNKATSLLLSGMFVLGIGGAALARKAESGQNQQKGIKEEPIPYSKPDSGAQMYKDYCAACHGSGGKGDGPAVQFLKVQPPDLTKLAQRNGGKFPDTKVQTILQFGPGSRAHGTSEMPTWGPLFRSEGSEDVAQIRIHNLQTYLESLQQK